MERGSVDGCTEEVAEGWAECETGEAHEDGSSWWVGRVFLVAIVHGPRSGLAFRHDEQLRPHQPKKVKKNPPRRQKLPENKKQKTKKECSMNKHAVFDTVAGIVRVAAEL